MSKKIYNWDTDTFEVVREDEVPSRSGGPVATNTMMNSKTRSILDRLKESTAALQGELEEPQEQAGLSCKLIQLTLTLLNVDKTQWESDHTTP